MYNVACKNQNKINYALSQLVHDMDVVCFDRNETHVLLLINTLSLIT